MAYKWDGKGMIKVEDKTEKKTSAAYLAEHTAALEKEIAKLKNELAEKDNDTAALEKEQKTATINKK